MANSQITFWDEVSGIVWWPGVPFPFVKVILTGDPWPDDDPTAEVTYPVVILDVEGIVLPV